jgi:hypothetical protein
MDKENVVYINGVLFSNKEIMLFGGKGTGNHHIE